MLELTRMRLVCPGCGAIASLEAWENDAAMRQFFSVLTALPPRIQQIAPRYLGLFRKGERGLAWKRALRLIQELQELVALGTVHWEGGETRPTSAELWASVMEEMIYRGLKELDGHNYLIKTVWSEAKGRAAKAEADRENAKKHRVDVLDTNDEPATEEDRRAVANMLKQFRRG